MRKRSQQTLFPPQLGSQWPARYLLTKRRSDVGLEQLEAAALLAGRHAIGVGAEVSRLVAELFVVAAHFVDHLLRAADQRRTSIDKVLDRVEHHREAGTPLKGQACLEGQPVLVD